ncbi:MAG: 30S ribosomal protein S20 [Desulfobacteraceae bacterium]|nr:MAG: 30S ribosomal protein S20 [Desulfobacteraceae bacterium]
MANHASAIKRNLQSQKRRLRNRVIKTRVKSVVKQVRAAGQAGEAASLTEDLRIAQSVIDKAAKKGVLHKRTAARKISRLARRVGQAASAS